MTKELIEIIRDCCTHFKFWYTQYTANKEATMLGNKYKDFYVDFSEAFDHSISVKIYNGIYEGNPKCISIQMPVETRENLLVPFKALGLNDVVTYLEKQFKTI